jgi:hypothetical protein
LLEDRNLFKSKRKESREIARRRGRRVGGGELGLGQKEEENPEECLYVRDFKGNEVGVGKGFRNRKKKGEDKQARQTVT